MRNCIERVDTHITSRKMANALTVRDVNNFKDSLEDGDILSYGRKLIKIVKKYPNWVMTDRGSMLWVDLYLFTKGKRPALNGYIYENVGR